MESADDLSPALQGLLDRFAGLVRGVGWRHGLSDHELDELTQAVRLRLWKARGTAEQIAATPASYVYRTAMTAALDLIRGRRSRHEEPIDVIENVALREHEPTVAPGGSLEAAELAATVASAVERITASRRPVLRMYLAGYDREEIAGLMGWSEAKTRNLLYRGLADLRTLLTARGIGPGGSR